MLQSISCAFQVDVDERWSAEQLLSHDFLKMAAESRKIVPLINAAKQQLDKQNHWNLFLSPTWSSTSVAYRALWSPADLSDSRSPPAYWLVRSCQWECAIYLRYLVIILWLLIQRKSTVTSTIKSNMPKAHATYLTLTTSFYQLLYMNPSSWINFGW